MSATLCPALPAVEPAEATSSPTTAAIRAVRWVGRVVAVLLVAMHAYVGRHAINPDAVSYLDVASAYAAGDLGAARNYYWSPLYSWLLALGLLVRPVAYWDAAVAH